MHPGWWTEHQVQNLSSVLTATVGLPRPYHVTQSNKSPMSYMFILSGPELHGTYLSWFCLSLQADSPTGRSWNKLLASLWESSPNKCKSLGTCVWVYRGIQDPRCLYCDSLTLRYLLLVGVDIGQEDKMMSEGIEQPRSSYPP